MKILIATDGSEYGDAAVNYAANVFGANSRAEFKVVTVLEPAAGTELEMIIESTEQLLDAHNQLFLNAEKVVQEGVKVLKDSGAVSVEHKVLAGPPARSIVEMADEWNADLIVVGSHGRGFWSRALLGSVSDSVSKHAKCSVLVVRKKA